VHVYDKDKTSVFADKINNNDEGVQGIKSVILIDEESDDRDIGINRSSEDRVLVSRIDYRDGRDLLKYMDQRG